MAEELLDDPQVRSALEKVRRERVAEGVGRDADRQPGPAPQQLQPIAQAADAEGAAAAVEEDHLRLRLPRRAPAGEDRPAVGEIDVERRPGRPSQQADPLLAALAEDPDLAAAEVQGRQLGGG